MRSRDWSSDVCSSDRRTGGDPYRRQLVLFRNVLDRNLNAELVEVRRVEKDMSDFRLEYDPNHPAANQDGFVEMPNVNPLVEMMDMREAQRSYEANLNMIDVTRSMMSRTIDLLRSVGSVAGLGGVPEEGRSAEEG